MNKRIYGLGSVLAIASVIPFAVACSSNKNKLEFEKVSSDLKSLQNRVKTLSQEYADLKTSFAALKDKSAELKTISAANIARYKGIFDEIVAGYNKIKANPIIISDKITIAIDVIEDLEFDISTAEKTVKTIFDNIEIFSVKIQTQLNFLKDQVENLFDEKNRAISEGKDIDTKARDRLKDLEELHESQKIALARNEVQGWSLNKFKALVKKTWLEVKKDTKFKSSFKGADVLEGIINSKKEIFGKPKNQNDLDGNLSMDSSISNSTLKSNDSIKIKISFDGKSHEFTI